MKRLFKITFLFLGIFFIGIYFTVKSINNSFSSEESIETVTINPPLLTLSIQI
jgi:hypothetical protein